MKFPYFHIRRVICLSIFWTLRTFTDNKFFGNVFLGSKPKSSIFKLNEKDYTDNQIKSELENENLDLLGYAALVIDELKLQKVDFQMHKNETQ